MDSDIRDALARSLPDLALIVRRDGVILSCVGGHAVRGLDRQEEEIPGRTLDTLWPESVASHVLADRAQNPQDTQARATALPGRRPQARDALPGAGLRPRARRVPRPGRRRHGQRFRPVSAERQRHAAASRRLRKIPAHGARHGRAARRHRGCRSHSHRRLRHLSTRVRLRARQSPARVRGQGDRRKPARGAHQPAAHRARLRRRHRRRAHGHPLAHRRGCGRRSASSRRCNTRSISTGRSSSSRRRSA